MWGWTLQVLGHDGTAIELLPQCDFMVVADRAVSAADLAAASRFRMSQHQGVGYERIDISACRDRGIPLGLTPEGTTTGVAEHTMLPILALYKQLLKAASGVRTGHWMQWELRQNSFELAGKTLGLAGVSFFFRPDCTPRRRASLIPACVRSTIKLRSSSASTPIICHMARSVGVAVSIASVSEWNFTPRARREVPPGMAQCNNEGQRCDQANRVGRLAVGAHSWQPSSVPSPVQARNCNYRWSSVGGFGPEV